MNVDISNSCFWHETCFDRLVYALSGANNEMSFIASCQPQDGKEPRIYKHMRRLAKSRFTVKHRGRLNGKEHDIPKISIELGS